MWQTLESKARFIAQVMTGDATVRKAEDIDAATLTYAEVKAIASGNPWVIEKATVDAEIIRLTRLRKQHLETHYETKARITNYRKSIQRYELQIEDHKVDVQVLQSTRGDLFRMKIGGEYFAERANAGTRLISLAEELKGGEALPHCGEIAGFPFSITHSNGRACLRIEGRQPYISNISSSELGTIASLENALREIPTTLKDCQERLLSSEKNLADLEKLQDRPFEYEQKLQQLRSRQQEILDALDLTKNQRAADEQVSNSADNQQVKANAVAVKMSP